MRPELRDHAEALGLPAGFADRAAPPQSDLVDEVLALRSRFSRRNFLLGVLLAYVGVAEQLLAQRGTDRLDDVFLVAPPLETTAGGAPLNTLTLGDPPVSLRTYYNLVERVIRHDLVRSGYPNSAPHATQSWTQHRREFELIAAMTPGERLLLAEALWAQVLDLAYMGGTGEGVREIRPFEAILNAFPSPVPREPGGAVLQGLAYAYYRADSPNVTLRIYKVGSGSSRVGAIGDVDGWLGDTPALTVEVKDMDIAEGELSQFDQFVKHLSGWPNATAVVLARSFTDEAVRWLAERNVLAFDRPRMASNVAYWDLPKQKLAAREFLYFLAVVQTHAGLLKRFRDFCAEQGIELA